MGDAPYELLALGLRYWFVLLLLLTLLRAVYLMWSENRAYQKALRRLPDAGTIGEVVDLQSGKSQPLPREGLLGSGRGCDIRFPRLHRREMEFVFRPGLGLKLIPIHRKHQSILDGEPLNKADSYALHGTILEIHGHSLRFRLFAGLDLPNREPFMEEGEALYTDGPSSPWEAPLPYTPPDQGAAPDAFEEVPFTLPGEYLTPPTNNEPNHGEPYEN